MLWAIYNAIPPYLILHFAIFGRVSSITSCLFSACMAQMLLCCKVLELAGEFSGSMPCIFVALHQSSCAQQSSKQQWKGGSL